MQKPRVPIPFHIHGCLQKQTFLNYINIEECTLALLGFLTDAGLQKLSHVVLEIIEVHVLREQVLFT